MLLSKKLIGFLYNHALTTILFLIISSTLTISGLFIYASLTPYYLYTLSIAVFIILTGLILSLNKTIKITVSTPIWMTIIWCLYITLHGLLISGNLNLFHNYLILNCVFLVGLSLLIQITNYRFTLICRVISFIAFIESSICIGQYLGCISNFNNDFKVTGTWENPNVTAMFIAMSVPALFCLIFHPKALYKKLGICCLIIVVVALVLLQCRTALIGSIVSVFILLNNRYSIIHRIKNSSNRSGSILLISFCLALIIPLAISFYGAKKASADGRKLIWKLSIEMIKDKPITGYGYGLFGKNYNLFQSQYFKSGNGSYSELQNAGFVHMGYNEFLQNGVEGGVLGLVIIGALFLILLSVPISQKQALLNIPNKTRSSNVIYDLENNLTITYAGIAAFAVMSLFNFSLQAIPAMCLFVIYAAILSTNPNYQKNKFKAINLVTKPVLKWSIIIALILIGLKMGLADFRSAYTGILIKKAEQQAGNNNAIKAINILKTLETKPYLFESYYITYADILFKQKNYSDAIAMYNKSKVYTSDPEIYIKTAFCYEKTLQYQNAESNYLIAKYIEPNRIAARFALMQLYLKNKDMANAISTAQEIVSIKPKFPSNKAFYYKQQAYIQLKRMGITFHSHQLNINSESPFTSN